MEILIALTVGTFFGTGLYLCLRRRTFQLVLGMALISHGVNIFILSMGRIRMGAPPLLGETGPPFADPLVQALILTAIVIGFGLTAFLLVLSYRACQRTGSDDVNTGEPS